MQLMNETNRILFAHWAFDNASFNISIASELLPPDFRTKNLAYGTATKVAANLSFLLSAPVKAFW